MTPSEKIDLQIAKITDWRADVMRSFRKLILDTQPNMVEDWKWDTGVWMYNKKLICAFSAFKNHVKFNFFNGADLKDSHKLFNNGFDSKKHRSIDISEGQKIDEKKLSELIQEAVDSINS
jgi:hypothetical protein